jgi:hypothetical protein
MAVVAFDRADAPALETAGVGPAHRGQIAGAVLAATRGFQLLPAFAGEDRGEVADLKGALGTLHGFRSVFFGRHRRKGPSQQASTMTMATKAPAMIRKVRRKASASWFSFMA